MDLPTLRDFVPIGTYNNGAFSLTRPTKISRGVYIWAHRENGDLVPRRVGIAVGRGGIAARYGSYNRWLAGKFKPDNEREQQVRRLTLEGLGVEAVVLGFQVDDRAPAIAIEKGLRALWSATMRLDLMVPDSWMKTEMAKWRTARKSGSSKDVGS